MEHDSHMTEDCNRATAQRFFELFSAGDIEGALALMTEDATWRIPGKKELTPTAGLYTKERIARLFRRMLDALVDGLRMNVVSSLAEGDRVALEVTSSGDLKNGRLFWLSIPVFDRSGAVVFCAAKYWIFSGSVK
jgi:ketosteroid isomerase-like protein